MYRRIKQIYEDYYNRIKSVIGNEGHNTPVEITLNNGLVIPTIGYGTFKLNGEECEKCVYNALKCGYRLIDTAAAYENELHVGNAIKLAIEDGICTRTDIIVSTKIWVQDFGEKETDKAFKRSMTRLGLDYLDICLLHYPFGDVYGAWRALEHIYLSGKVKAIGVSNFPNDRLMDLLLHTSIKPVVNQVETNPFIQQVKTQVFLRQCDIIQEAWSPLATGKQGIWENKVLTRIADKYGVSVGQVVIRWLMQRSIVPIVKSSSEEHMIQNKDVFGFELNQNEMLSIARINKECSVYYGKEGVHNIEVVKQTGGAQFRT